MERKDVTVNLGTARAVAGAGLGVMPPAQDAGAGDEHLDASGGEQGMSAASEYEVNILDRIRELALESDLILTPESHVCYSWQGGYETFKVESIPGKRGGSEYAGAYHPDGTCSDGGVCCYCGSVNW